MGGGGDTGVHCCAHSGILEELLSVFDNQVVWFECCLSILCDGLCEFQLRFMARNTVLCGTKMSYAFLLIMNGTPSHMSNGQNHFKQEVCKQQENSIMSQKRFDTAHWVTFSKSLDF